MDIFTTLDSYSFPEHQVIIEIGAADLLDSDGIVKATKFNQGEYYAFEPDPTNIILAKSAKIQSQPFFVLMPVAVGDSNERTAFHRSNGFNENLKREHTYSGSLKNPVEHLKIHPWCKFEETIMVPMIKLDSFTKMFSVDVVHFLWCDVQGAEDLVIKGAQLTLERTHLFYTEFYNSELYECQMSDEEIFKALPGAWRVVRKWDNDILFENLSLPPIPKSTVNEHCNTISSHLEKV